MKFKEVMGKVKYNKDLEEREYFESIAEDFDVLDEGLKYFRTSKRLYKLSDKLEGKVEIAPQIKPFINKVRRTAKRFMEVEDAFKKGTLTKKQAKVKVAEIKYQYIGIMNILKDKEKVAAFKAAGVVATIGGIIASLLFGFSPLLVMVGASALSAALPTDFKQSVDKETLALKQSQV